VRLPGERFPSVELRAELLVRLHLRRAEEESGRFGIPEAEHFARRAAEDRDRHALAVPAEELAVNQGCGDASTFEVRPDRLRQEAVVPLRDVSRGEYWFEHARQITCACKSSRDGKSTRTVYLCSLVDFGAPR